MFSVGGTLCWNTMPADAPPVIDIGILTIRDDEFRAVLDAFPKKAGVHRGKRREYTLRYAETADNQRYTLAILKQIEQGNGEAQDAARDLLDDLEPTMLLVVGIAAGLPSDDITLGDVVIATRVNDYTVEARKARETTTYSVSGGPIAKELQARIANLVGREKDLGRWTSKLPRRPEVSWTLNGQLYGPKRWQNEVRDKLEAHFGRGAKPRPPTFTSGPIASSDRLVKDPKVLIPWLQTARHLHAIEMEAAGVYRAARERCLMLAIRGISDIVGLKRSEAWTKYACLSAAAFARAFLRTRPIEPKTVRTATTSSANTKASASARETANPRLDTLYLNMARLSEYPRTIYVAPTDCGSLKHAWGRLRDGAKGYVTQAWVLHGKNIYSFVDPSSGYLAKVVDTTRIEAHDARQWSESTDPDQRRLFVHLLGGALKDDLAIFGVRFARDDRVYMFAGRLDEPPRRYRYRNVRVPSTLTVVSKYTHTYKDGTETPYLRHLAFDGRFRYVQDEWYLEISPTYRFTADGRTKFWGHEKRLSGIKRLEGNRSVLSQVLLWSSVLSSDPGPDRPRRHLRFDALPKFEIEQPIADDELTSIEVASTEIEPASDLLDRMGDEADADDEGETR